MIETGRCPLCHGAIFADSLEGLCPECLFQQALADPQAAADREEATRSPAPPFVPPTPEELAPHFPQLEILGLVGQGGMGAVYKARQPKLDRLVAVKILPSEIASDLGFTERFSREARSLARLNHPNILTIFDFGKTDGLYYFTMEFVDGKNARQLLEAGELTPATALKIIPQVCDALQYAHDEGFVHRDIKPENILLDKKGRVKIADFGLARLIGLTPTYLTLTGSHQVMGTLYYMAPEQMKRTHAVDHRADLYSLGVVFYELLTGELPVGRFAPPSHKAPVDVRLDPVVLRALAREPELRYQDAAELKREVESISASGSSALPAAGPRGSPERIRVVGDWPSVHFTIPQIFRTGGQAKGEVHRDEESLIVEFQESWGFWRSGQKVVRIPFQEITSISCQSESLPDVPSIPEWGRKWIRLKEWMAKQSTQLVIKAAQPAALTGLPIGKPGKGRLLIRWGERDAAKQLVDSIVQQPFRKAGANDSRIAKEVLPADVTGHGGTRMEVIPPAIGLLLTGIVAALTWIGWTIGIFVEMDMRRPRDSSVVLVIFTACFAIAMCAVAFQLQGAVKMLRLRSYPLAVAAALLAMLPWSFAWIVSLPFGIWALRVLRRPEVRSAFLKNRLAADSPPAPPHTVTYAPTGKMASFFRSVAGYMLPSVVGRRSSSQSSAVVPELREQAVPSPGAPRSV